MSEELKKLERQLEEATAADGAADTPLDAETASLRETWLAFGELLDTAYPPGDAPIKMPLAPRNSRRGRWLSAAALLAASLLIGVTLVWNSIEPDQVAKPEKKETPQIEPVQTVAIAETDLQWDDTIDEQLAQVGQGVVQIQQDWHQLSDPFSSLQEGFGDIEDDMDESTL